MVVFALTGCAATAHAGADATLAPSIANAAYASGPELQAVSFKARRPADRDSLLSAVARPDEAIAALEHNIELMNAVPSARFAVIATTDNRECQAEECTALSLKRARLVHDWLVLHGVSAARLEEPIGRGSAMPLHFEASEEERAIVRSVQLVIR